MDYEITQNRAAWHKGRLVEIISLEQRETDKEP